MSKPPNPRWEIFAVSYAKHGNATQAAREAGYKGSDDVIRSQGHRLLTKAHIRDLIKKYTDPVLEKKIIDKDEWFELVSQRTKNAKNDFAFFRGSELLGRAHQLFVEKHIHEISVPEIKVETDGGKPIFSLSSKKATGTNNDPSAQIPGTDTPQ